MMIQTHPRVTFKRTRTGRIIRRVEETYARTDISCRWSGCEQCSTPIALADRMLSSTVSPLIIPTSHVLQIQLDLWCALAKVNAVGLVVLESVLNSIPQGRVYRRILRDLLELEDVQKKDSETFSNAVLFSDLFHGEIVGERGRRIEDQIGAAVTYYSSHIKVPVFFVVEDVEKWNALKFSKVHIVDMPQMISELGVSRMSPFASLVAETSTDQDSMSLSGRDKPGFLPHLKESEVKQRLHSASNPLYKATLRVCRGAKRAYAMINIEENGTSKSQEVVILGSDNINRAFDGDEVAIELLQEKEAGKCTAKVRAIVSRNWREYAGSIREARRPDDITGGNGWIWFSALNEKIPLVRVQTQDSQHLEGQRFVIRVDGWLRDSHVPHGHLVRVLGPIGDRDTETAAILIEHEIRDFPFPKSVLSECPALDWKVGEEHMANRVDLRDTRIFSIDPPGCVDIDDALHITKLDDGNFEVGVHIADVSAFVPEGCAIDMEAKERATSVYLVERRIDMIPGRLSTQICSLRSGTDRLAFSVVWKLDVEANIVDVKFHKSVIRSVAELAYRDAQAHLDKKIPLEQDKEDGIGRDCRLMNHLARILRLRRIKAGALTLASPQAKFAIDREKDDKPTDLECYKLKEANALVEEFMLLANISVARHICQAFSGRALLRRHPQPLESRLQVLVEAGARIGATLDTSTSKSLADSLDEATRGKSEYFDQALRILVTRCMNQAVYFSSGMFEQSDYHHYGLASPIYTHFTSPIRRYADLVVHRLLASSLSLMPAPLMAESRSSLQELCNHLNHRNRQSQMCQRASVELYTILYFHGKTVSADAVIMGIEPDRVPIFVPRFGIEGYLAVPDKDEEQEDPDQKMDTISVDEAKHVASIPGVGEKRAFDQIRVQIIVEEGRNGRKSLVYKTIGSQTGELN